MEHDMPVEWGRCVLEARISNPRESLIVQGGDDEHETLCAGRYMDGSMLCLSVPGTVGSVDEVSCLGLHGVNCNQQQQPSMSRWSRAGRYSS